MFHVKQSLESHPLDSGLQMKGFDWEDRLGIKLSPDRAGWARK